MSEHDPFERELREVLDDLASAPAPEGLRARVGAIPQLEPSRTSGARSFLSARGNAFRVLSTLAAAAVIVVAGALIVTTLPGGGNRPGGHGGAASSPTKPAATPRQGTAQASATVGTVVVVPTPGSTAGVGTTPAPAGIPTGFQAASVTFVSTQEGWALGGVPCSSGTCASIIRTTDGGRTWTPQAAPSTPFAQAPQPGSGPGVGEIRFANALDGWAYAPDLWSTHDGGATWTRVAIPGLGSGSQIVALEAADGRAQAVAWDGSGSYRIATSVVGKDEWSLATVKVPVGAGPVPQIQLVLAGAGGWMVEVDRTVVGGARLANGTWTPWTPPCSNAMGTALLDAATPTDLVAECDGGQWGTPKDARQAGQHLYVSTDGGATFAQSKASVPLVVVSAISTPTPSTIVLAGSRGQSTPVGAIARSTNGGTTWSTVDLPSGWSVSYLGFTTPTQGVAIVDNGTASHLYMTYDGGASWSETASPAS